MAKKKEHKRPPTKRRTPGTIYVGPQELEQHYETITRTKTTYAARDDHLSSLRLEEVKVLPEAWFIVWADERKGAYLERITDDQELVRVSTLFYDAWAEDNLRRMSRRVDAERRNWDRSVSSR